MRGLGTDHIISATATDSPPANFPIQFFSYNFVLPLTKKFCQNHENGRKEKKIVSLLGKIRRTRFNLRSPCPPEEVVLNYHRHTDTQADGHGDSMAESTSTKNSILFLYNGNWVHYTLFNLGSGESSPLPNRDIKACLGKTDIRNSNQSI